jgi:hypothetical protein
MHARAGLLFKGKEFTAGELKLVQEVVCSCAGLSRQELANTVCELLQWRRNNGGLKTWECKELLVKLEQDGLLELPALRVTKPHGATTHVPHTKRGERQQPLVGTVRDVAPVLLCAVRDEEQRRWWRELVGRYHYLGHRVPFGAHLRYLIYVTCPRWRVVGCLQLSSPAWKMAARDQWIGWDEQTRRVNLQRIVNHSRFLLLPWVQVRNLASHVLAKMVREFPPQWEQAYAVRPLLVETLVDQQRFRGTCYRAANWQWLGTTQGRGRMDRGHQRQGASPKELFVYPLVAGVRERLTQKGA